MAFDSRLSAHDAAQQLAAAIAASRRESGLRHSLVGRIDTDSVVLIRRSSFRSPFLDIVRPRPAFIGTLGPRDGGCKLDGRFTYRGFERCFLVFGLTFVLLLSVTLAAGAVALLATTSTEAVVIPVLYLVVAALLLIAAVRASQPFPPGEIAWLSEQIRSILRAV
jgi:hypothetical protein